MTRWFLKRLAGTAPTLLVLVTAVFFLVRLAPGGPFDNERQVSPDVAAAMARAYRLDEPLPMQFLRYLGNLVQGDFGPSFKYVDLTVGDLIWRGFPVSLQLGLTAMALAVVIGGGLGILAALKRNRLADHAVMATALVGMAVPNFVLAPILTLIIGVWLHWLPVGGWGDSWTQGVLPVVALALPQVAVIARVMRGSLIEAMHSAFILTARAKGLPRRLVVGRHALRAALMPVISYLGPAAATIVTGSVVVEQIFSIPGIGRYFVTGALNRDYTLVMGVVLVYGTLIILANLAVDLLYGWLDPRLRETGEGR